MLCSKCLSTLSIGMERSQRATVMAWGPCQSTFWLGSQQSLWDPASQDRGLRSSSKCASGKFCLSFRGPIRRAQFLSGPCSTPLGTAVGKSHCSPSGAGCYLWSLQATGEARSLASPCCCSPWGRLLEVTAKPQDDHFYFSATQAIRRASLPSTSLFDCPCWAWWWQVTVQAGVASVYHHGNAGHQRGTGPLRAFAPLPLLGVAARGEVRTCGRIYPDLPKAGATKPTPF